MIVVTPCSGYAAASLSFVTVCGQAVFLPEVEVSDDRRIVLTDTWDHGGPMTDRRVHTLELKAVP